MHEHRRLSQTELTAIRYTGSKFVFEDRSLQAVNNSRLEDTETSGGWPCRSACRLHLVRQQTTAPVCSRSRLIRLRRMMPYKSDLISIDPLTHWQPRDVVVRCRSLWQTAEHCTLRDQFILSNQPATSHVDHAGFW